MDFNASPTHQPPSQQVRRVRRKTVETYYLPFKPSQTLWHTISPVLFGIGCERGCRDCTGEPLLLHKTLVPKMVKAISKDAEEDTRQQWKDKAHLQAFCEFCAAQVLAGRRNGGFLSKKGVAEVINSLAEIGKNVTRLQVESKWDHLRRNWKIWKEISQDETGVGIDPNTGMIEATDEWWGRKIAQCSSAKTIRTSGLPHLGSLEIMFGGTAATGKDAFTLGQTPIACTEGSRDSFGSKEFVDPQCEEPLGVDPMFAEGPSVSRSAATVNKGKGLAANVQLFKEPSKRRPKPHTMLQEMGSTLKAMSDVIIESRSASTRTSPVSVAAIEVQKVMDMVISLPGVQLGDRLHMFSADFFMGHPERMHMFFALAANTEVQLQWLEKQFDKMPEHR